MLAAYFFNASKLLLPVYSVFSPSTYLHAQLTVIDSTGDSQLAELTFAA